MVTSSECKTDSAPGAAAKNGSGDQKKAGVDWADPRVPIGNSPLLPRWPLALAGIAWLAWVGFLIAMALSSDASPVIW